MIFHKYHFYNLDIFYLNSLWKFEINYYINFEKKNFEQEYFLKYLKY